MTKIIGLTGGIGSGKTTVAELFEKQGVPVYYADLAGRRLMDNPAVTSKIIQEFGLEICDGAKIDRKALAKLVFGDKSKLALLNSIIHPAVAADFAHWVETHKHKPLVVKESAILFESGAFKSCDAVVTVSAPEALRIERVIKRDQALRQDVIDRIENQWNDSQREDKSDFVIVNVNKLELADQVSNILKKLQNL